MEENNIDKYFKERLHEHAVVPSVDVWDRIDAQLAGKKDVKAAGLQWRSVALLSLALLLLVSGLFYWRMDRLDKENSALERELTEQRAIPVGPTDVDAPEETKTLETESPISHLENSEVTLAADVVGTNSEPEVEIESKPAQSNSKTQTTADLTIKNPQGNDIENPDNSVADITQAQRKIIEDSRTSGTGISSVILSSTDPLLNDDELSIAAGSTNSSDQTTGEPRTETAPPSLLSTAPSENASGTEIDQRNDLNIGEFMALEYIPIDIEAIHQVGNESELMSSQSPAIAILYNGRSKFSYGIAVSRNSTFRRIQTDASENDLENSLDRAESADNSFGARGFLNYNFSKRLSLSLGVEYSKWKQNGIYSVGYPADVDIFTTGIGGAEYNFETELLTSTGYDDVSLSAVFFPGNVPWDTESLEAQEYFTEVQVDETIEWFSVPLTLNYQTYLGRWGLQGGIGVSYDHLFKASTESRIEGDFRNSQVNDQSYTRDGFISAQAEVGVFYRISNRTKIHAGPRFRSWLIPLYENDRLRTYPYSNAIEVGLEIGL